MLRIVLDQPARVSALLSVLASVLVGGVVSGLASDVETVRQTKVTRPPVCRAALKEYRDPREVPVPHDTVIPPTDGGGNLVQITDLASFREQLLVRAAGIGANGYISYRPSGDEVNGRQALGRILPVFVPADSARAFAECRRLQRP